jgi:hypothetical protein
MNRTRAFTRMRSPDCPSAARVLRARSIRAVKPLLCRRRLHAGALTSRARLRVTASALEIACQEHSCRSVGELRIAREALA